MKKIIFIFALICNLTFAIEDCSSQWSQVNLPVTGSILRMQFTNQSTGWLTLSNNYMLRTTNGGINWSVITDSSSHVYYYQFINDTLGYSTGMNYLTPVFQKTTNGGVNWIPVYYPTPFALGSVFFINANTGWADGFIFPGTVVIEKTTNGGQTFENVYTGAGSAGGGDVRLTMIKDSSSNEYYGYHYYNGNLYKSTNSGYNWTQLSFSEAGSVNSFSFLNKDTGFVVYFPNLGNNTIILYTSNAGLNWVQRYYYNVNYGLGNIQMVNNEKIWCGGDYMLKSTNGGNNWGRQNCQIIYPSGIYMIDTTYGFAWNGYSVNNFARTINGGGPLVSIKNIAENIPNKYKLNQNFPNPFNQSTIISYQLSIAGNVKIKVFDITGKEINTLVNERKTVGRYSVRFDAGNLSSGIYFYSLYANGIRFDTRKMLLIK